tara:strand:- start:76 stop:930 length:855 start_codon:yes stop_codon:yes gene_type:complete
MTTNLPATASEMTDHEIAMLSGTVAPEQQSNLAIFAINYLEEDQDDVDISKYRGHFAIHNGTEKVYGLEPTYKILGASNQVRHYDATANNGDGAYVAETIFFDNPFNMKAEDTAGTLRCGKVSKKERELLSPGDQELQSKMKVYRITWGIVNMVGVNAAGEEAVATNIPCMMRSGGKGFMPMSDYLEANAGNVHNIVTTFRTTLHKKPIKHWEVQPVMGEDARLTDVELETMKALMEEKQKWNREVMTKWRKANGIVESKPLSEVSEEFSAVLIDSDVDDEIPF